MSTPTPPLAAASASSRLRPLGVTVVAVVALVLGSMMLVGAALLIGAGTLQGPWGNFHEFGELSFWLPAGALAAGLALALVGGLHVAVGVGLVRGRAWAWGLALALVLAQVVSGLVAAVGLEFDQLSQAVAYAVAGLALLTPRARAWLTSA